MKKPNKALLDGDILAYRAAYWADKEGIDGLEHRLQQDIKFWTPLGCSSVCIALSCKRVNNFRRGFWKPYKEHRDKTLPPTSLPLVLESIKDINKSCFVREETLEADDLLGIGASSGEYIAVSIDKDLVQTPGWHWNPDKQPMPMEVSLEEADNKFLEQWITGDTSDNIWGLWKWGPAKAKVFLKKHAQKDAYSLILNEYINEDWSKRSIDKTPVDMTKEEFAISQARSVRILRNGEFNTVNKDISLWNLPITEVLETKNGEIL